MSQIEIIDPNLQALLQKPFATLNNLDGVLYRSQLGRKTIAFEFQNQNYFAKIHNGVGWKEIFKNILQLRLPIIGAKTEWNALLALQTLAIPAPIVVAYGSKGINPSSMQSFIITKALPDSINLEDYFKQNKQISFMDKKKIITAVAAIAKKLHSNGINHRDFYLCHFLLDKHDRGDMPLIYIIDLHRAQMRNKVPLRWQVKDISGLYFSSMDLNFTRQDYLRFLKEYTGKSIDYILKHYNVFLSRVQKRAEALYRKNSSSTL